MRAVLAASDVLVLPSLTEGVPGVLVEAGLVGIPVVATDVGGVSTVVEDGVSGLLVPAQDQAALDRAVTRALNAGPEMGQAATKRCRRDFDLDKTSEAWDCLLRYLASRSTSSPTHANDTACNGVSTAEGEPQA